MKHELRSAVVCNRAFSVRDRVSNGLDMPQREANIEDMQVRSLDSAQFPVGTTISSDGDEHFCSHV